MYERVKDQQAWQLEQGQELSALKEKIDTTQEIGVANCILDGQMAMGLAGLEGCVELLERQGRFLLDWQEQDSNAWHNVVKVGKGLLAGGMCVWSDEHQSANNKFMRTFLSRN